MRFDRDILNRTIDAVRWPSLILLLISVWPVTQEFVAALAKARGRDSVAIYVTVGVAAYVAGWLCVSRQRTSKTLSLLMTLEHECTHAIVALLSLNSLDKLFASSDAGGKVIVHGRSNWLVLVAPYVMPTSLIVMWPLLVWAPKASRATLLIVFGVLLAFHIHTTIRETHAQQTDLQRLGWGFVVLFLPVAHVWAGIWVCGLLLGNQTHWLAAWRKTLDIVVVIATRIFAA